MNLREYITSINKRFKSKIASEHSYRSDLEVLLRTMQSGIDITNEPSHVTNCGNPDYVITKGKIPIGYIEAKDIGKDLSHKQYNEQFGRYKKAFDNLIITDYIRFQFFKSSQLVCEVKIAEIEGSSINPIEENFQEFTTRIHDFCLYIGQTIKSSKKLAELMASKARLLQVILEHAITSDEQSSDNTSLKDQFESFKKVLIHDLTPKEFADIYAQTLAYGMFAARLHDTSPNDFSREEAARLIPKTNPFLRKLFQHVAGFDIDPRIQPTVDNLVEVFRATDLEELLKNFGQSTQMTDPIIHFYETFLSEYDPKLRKKRGVWYTPAPVVNFIVRAVDDILKTEFGLSAGLADTSKTKVKLNIPGTARIAEKEMHRVQILDPATGTGTFLAEVVKHIYENNFSNLQGAWGGYVDDHLIPRLNGFELLMASYTIAHLKLDILFANTGYKPKKEQRFNIYLTNSLEEFHPDTGTLFANWLSSEANEANHIKRDSPVMVVIGNPPYSVSSSNKSEWIEHLTSDYKKDMNEKNIQPLSDDYIKFIRFGQYFIEKNGTGVLAYISNNSFVTGLIHRQMRKQLLSGFDTIYILDLHGNIKKKETELDGGLDQNVFDIMQGVSINIFIKTGKKKTSELGKVFHFDLFGKRASKYDFLQERGIKNILWSKITSFGSDYSFVHKDIKIESDYSRGFSITDLFPLYASGVTTERDHLTIQIDNSKLIQVLEDIKRLDEKDFRSQYTPKPDGRDWKIEYAKKDVDSGLGEITEILYRPFDIRKTFYSGKSKGFMAYPRNEIMQHLLKRDNLALLSCRQQTSFDFQHVFISKMITERCTVSLQTGEVGYVFPLYLYPPDTNETSVFATERTPNINSDIANRIAIITGMVFTEEKTLTESSFAPIDIFDYVYAVLHSPSYRKKYKLFLKSDFPRVPFPKNLNSFRSLISLGGELRSLHLLEDMDATKLMTSYPETGSNILDKQEYINDRVYINDQQYFSGVSETAWTFYIGGYQPAQKWLKDRKGRILSFDDIKHYQKIITALNETDRLMKEIDKIKIE